MNKLNMKTIYYIGITILALWLGSCAQDDTVNSFKDLNEVTFNGLKEKYSVMLYDYLNIPLSLTTSQNDDSHLSYVWYLSTDTTRKVADTLSKSKDLNVLIDPSHAVPGENYTLTLKGIQRPQRHAAQLCRELVQLSPHGVKFLSSR